MANEHEEIMLFLFSVFPPSKHP